jgi:hypothetical protein
MAVRCGVTEVPFTHEHVTPQYGRCSQQLLMGGMHVPAIRPPTVQPGTSRLRLALSAAHSEQDVVQLVSLLCDTKVLDQAAAATTSLRDVARGGGNMQAQAL